MAYLRMGQFGPARAAFVEAKTRSPAMVEDIDKNLAWFDAKVAQARANQP